MERFLFKKIELWAVGLLLVLAFIGMLVFSNMAVYTALGGRGLGLPGRAAFKLSDMPGLVERMNNADLFRAPGGAELHAGKSGFSFSYAPGSRPDLGYLLLSRFDGDARRAYVELYDLNTQQMVHRWGPDTDAIFAGAEFSSRLVDLQVDRHSERLILRHPFLTDDGGLLLKTKTPLYKIDACNSLVWINATDAFHHSIEMDDEGVIWTSSHIEPSEIPGINPDRFMDDGIAALDADGTLLMNRSLPQIFIDNDMEYIVYGGARHESDPVHANDIQPVLEDGPHWQKGDLFISMRTPSMVMLYRPSTNEIVWHRQGPWILQHDVDILDDHRISIFDNNAAEYAGEQGILRTVEVMIYDFETGEVTSPWKDRLAELNVRSVTEGLKEILPGGELFVEETNYGRALMLAPDGALLWDYVNRAGTGDVYDLSWSRVIPRDRGDAIAERLGAAACG